MKVHSYTQCNSDWEEKKEDFTAPKTKGGLGWVSSRSTRGIGSSPPDSKECPANFKVEENEFIKERTIIKALEKSSDFFFLAWKDSVEMVNYNLIGFINLEK